jgi:hypothetical protein
MNCGIFPLVMIRVPLIDRGLRPLTPNSRISLGGGSNCELLAQYQKCVYLCYSRLLRGCQPRVFCHLGFRLHARGSSPSHLMPPVDRTLPSACAWEQSLKSHATCRQNPSVCMRVGAVPHTSCHLQTEQSRLPLYPSATRLRPGSKCLIVSEILRYRASFLSGGPNGVGTCVAVREIPCRHLNLASPRLLLSAHSRVVVGSETTQCGSRTLDTAFGTTSPP